MAELKESSVLFSINDLFERERDRVAEAAEREWRRIEAEQIERLERERRRLEQEEILRREQEQRARREEARCREESARIEALRQAEVARACAEADGKARIELDAKRREHELRLEGIRENVGRRRAEQLLAGCAIVALASWVAGAWFYFGQVKPEQRRVSTEYETVLAAERERTGELQRLLGVSERHNAELGANLKRTLDELAGARAVPLVPAGNAGRPHEVRDAGHDGKRQTPRGAPKPRRPCSDNGDPMDDCL